MDIENYRLPTGYYDTARIRADAGYSERAALFADIFGSRDDDGQDKFGPLPAPYQALLEEAERRNTELDRRARAAQAARAQETAARLMPRLIAADDSGRAPESWVWAELARVGLARREIVDIGEEFGERWELTEEGQRVYGQYVRERNAESGMETITDTNTDAATIVEVLADYLASYQYQVSVPEEVLLRADGVLRQLEPEHPQLPEMIETLIKEINVALAKVGDGRICGRHPRRGDIVVAPRDLWGEQ